MKNSRFTEEQIIQILKEGEGGSIADILRRYNIAKGTYYAWRSKYSGLELPEIKRLKKLEEENRKLKQLLAEAQLDIVALKDIVSKKW
ncbi:transposase [Candidatus Rhabdochlamydia sp. T3358]|uniref:transposase n=1 Tax=Candidatus Rhabdochlamydia sp. T3358 TaxID=2099795 RepID=UPI0010BBECBE|nr:transposase [Candidatus Rhabdochlamydia sp. T3358]VHO03594.1 Transposase [Candidatus Rhabdochlamydia sp. T3358]